MTDHSESTTEIRSDLLCPCGRGVGYVDCCQPLHQGTAAPTAERLMRSRYSAFVFQIPSYLVDTWHTSTRPVSLEFDQEVRWQRLFIESTVAGGPFDRTGEVTFTAIGRNTEGRFEHWERSRFCKDRDSEGTERWFYLDGGMQ